MLVSHLYHTSETLRKGGKRRGTKTLAWNVQMERTVAPVESRKFFL